MPKAKIVNNQKQGCGRTDSDLFEGIISVIELEVLQSYRTLR
jgi:hypothetical protein